MRDDLIEVIAAMIERRGQILAEEPVEQADAAHQRQRQTHQPPRAFEDQDCQQSADHKIELRRIAVARDQVGVKNPLIKPAQEAGAADHPARGPTGVALCGEVGDQAKGQQKQETDMNPAHDLARQHVPCRHHKLKYRKRDGYRIGQTSPAARAETFGKPVLETIELDFDGRLGVHALQHLLPSPGALVSSAISVRCRMSSPDLVLESAMRPAPV